MKEGLIRIDEVGRVVIPKEARKVLKIGDSRFAELYVERDKIIIKKYTPILNEIQLASKICERLSSLTSCVCLVCDTEKVVCASGGAMRELRTKKLSEQFKSRVAVGEPLLNNLSEGSEHLQLFVGYEINYNSICSVVLEHEEQIGYIILLNLDGEQTLTADTLNLLKMAKGMIEGVLK